MKDIIGLAVLSSPLFLVVPWLILAVFVAMKAAQLPKMGAARLAAGAATFVVVFLLPFADEIAGRVYFNHLCSTEAGVEVYQPVYLPAKYWNSMGRPTFYDDKNGNLHLPNNNLEWVSTTESYPLHLDKDISIMKEKSSGEILNERVIFTFWGGWIARKFSPHNTATSCKSDVHAYTNYVMQIFRPVPSSN